MKQIWFAFHWSLSSLLLFIGHFHLSYFSLVTFVSPTFHWSLSSLLFFQSSRNQATFFKGYVCVIVPGCFQQRMYICVNPWVLVLDRGGHLMESGHLIEAVSW